MCSAGTSHSQKAHVMPSGEQTRTCHDRMPHSPQGAIPQHLWVLKAPDVQEKSGCAFCPWNGGSRCELPMQDRMQDLLDRWFCSRLCCAYAQPAGSHSTTLVGPQGPRRTGEVWLRFLPLERRLAMRQGAIPQHLWVLKAPDVQEKSGCAFCPWNGGSRCGLLDVWFSSLAFFFLVRQ
ncbi:hypothetical protein Emed_007350 [Eimeria media]